jgi:hypothetical protein
MTSVKLLPGVGYTGMFNAMPSIRGGDPGDLTAVLDGFYLERPYYWAGSISIFDPKMVTSARLSHGVFSARYGHTISGLLEITSKSPSSTETELEAAIGSSMTSLNLSVPLNGKGGILFMGKVSYWDTLVWAAQGLSKAVPDDENLQMTNYITTPPYIRSAALSINYRFTPDLEWRLNGFFGSDGIGMDFFTDYSRFRDDDIRGSMEMKATYDNYQGFLISGLNASPTPKLALRLTGGVGFIRTITDDYAINKLSVKYNDKFLDDMVAETNDTDFKKYLETLKGKRYDVPGMNVDLEADISTFNAQIRTDVDYDIGGGLIAAFGIQELYTMWKQREDILIFMQMSLERLLAANNNPNLPPELEPYTNLQIIVPRRFSGDVLNHGLTTSVYGLLEYTSPNQFFGTELGLRVDHLYFKGRNFELMTTPVLNPRFNIDFNILKNKGDIDSLSVTAGTGLFSSINSLICFFDPDKFNLGLDANLDDVELKFNRSWTSIIGLKIDFLQKYSFNIEGYYKYVFDRTYITADTVTNETINPNFHFDGIGNVWGFDLQLQRMESRFIDGWISYTFTWAQYLDPSAGGEGISNSSTNTTARWYFPSYHRFHNANIVLNIKPFTWFHIGVRLGLASGQQQSKVSNEIEAYPVIATDEDEKIITDENGMPQIIQRYRRKRLPEDERGMERAAWTVPLDIKLSFFPVNRNGRTNMEIYVSGENLLALLPDELFPRSDRVSFNSYTGKEDIGGSTANFDMPIPLLSFGFKWRY